jgi:pimeloyl-ACP methyl ester carboxylesterase
MASIPKSYVLVHGAWHGGWCWRRVTPILRQRGHPVFTPTQTGLGERAHLLTKEVGFETFVEDVAGMIEMEELSDIVLVGHSFAGNVVTCIADRMPQRIAQLVYLDAAIPFDGESAFSPLPEAIVAERIELSKKTSGGLTMPIPDLKIFGVTEPADVQWITPHLRPHPIKTYTDQIRVKNPVGNGRPTTYIACTNPIYAPLARARDFAKKQPGWKYEEISCGHDAMVALPDRLAEMLLAVAK